jgi:dTDP-D-glucose 4,6-dehydratase
VKDDSRPGDQLVYVTDYSKLQRDTGWKPQVSVKQTLMRIQDWWKQNREVFGAMHVTDPVIVPAMQNVQGAA